MFKEGKSEKLSFRKYKHSDAQRILHEHSAKINSSSRLVFTIETTVR